MKNLIPFFIYDKYKKFINKGSFKAVTMFLDMSGFTKMTERLLKEGKAGAEELSVILNNVFEPLINAVYDRGGFISGFAGDGFTALFPNLNKPLAGCYAADTIREKFENMEPQKTKYGDFKISVKVGLSYGLVRWGILGSEKKKIFYFKGKPIEGCANAENMCTKHEIIMDEFLYKFISKIPEDQPIKKKYYKLVKMKKPEKDILDISSKNQKKYVVKKFISEVVLDLGYAGEFRDIVSVFISFKDIEDFDKLNDFVIHILEKLDTFGGYYSQLDYGDKGSNILIFFGAPTSYEDNIQRAINFILSLKKEFKEQIRAGVTYGIAYAGFMGIKQRSTYSCLGDVVNLSSRFMTSSSFGHVWISKEINERIKNQYQTKYIGEHQFKGFENKIPVYELIGRHREISSQLFEGQMIGRGRTMGLLRSYTHPAIEQQTGSVVYIYGEPGIGKSRIAYELAKSYGEQINFFTLQADGILKNSMNPFVSFFNNYFRQVELLNEKEKQDIFEKVYNEFLESLKALPDKETTEPMIKELIRTKSIIGALVGVYWKDSLYEQLDAKGKYENTLFAINDFFKAKSLIKPIIIILEDLQWLDVDSKKIFEIISRNMNDSPITLICSSRYTDEGDKPTLSIDKKILQNEILLDHMSIDEIEELTTENLSGEADSRLLSYIALKSEGNPFYIEQFCKFLKENDVIDMREGKYRLLRTNIDIPKGISSVLIARIDRLSADLKEMVQLASVLGREFDVQVIEELMNVVRYSLEFETTALRNKDLNKMLVEGVHERIWNALSEIKYIFRHTMLQSAVYEMQLRSRLKKLHKIAGECIEKIYRNDKNYYSDIAFHYENAAVWDKATEYLEKAADYAKDSYQNEQALKVYDRLIGYLEDEEKEIVIQTKKAEVLQFIGEWSEAEKLYRHNINRALEINNIELVAKNRKNLGSLLEKKGKNQEALTLLESVSNYYKEISDLKGLSSALGAIGVIYHKESDYEKAMEYYKRELNLAERMNDKKGISSSVGNMGILYKDRNDYDKAMECYQKQLEISEDINDKIGKSRAYANMGVLHYFMQKYDKAIDYYQKQLYLASELGNKLYISNTSGNMGVMYYLQNNHDKAIQYYLIQQEMSEQLGNKMGSASASTNLGLIYMDKGEHEKSLKYFKTSYQLFKELNNKQGQLQILVNLIILNKMMNNMDKADEYCEEGIKLAEELNSDYDLSEIFYERAQMYLMQGKIEEAEKLNDKSIAISMEIDEPKLITLTNILKSKIISKRGNNEEAINILEKILGELDEDDIDNKAPLLFELFKLTGKDEYKNSSLEMYKEIYEEDNSAEIKSKIDELKDNIGIENK